MCVRAAIMTLSVRLGLATWLERLTEMELAHLSRYSYLFYFIILIILLLIQNLWMR